MTVVTTPTKPLSVDAGTVTIEPAAGASFDINGPVTVEPTTGATFNINGPVKVTELPAPPSSIDSILTVRVTLKGLTTPVQVPTFTLTTGVIVKAEGENSTPAYVGGSTVTTSSFRLTPGELVGWPVDQASLVWAIGKTGDHLSVSGA